MGDIDDKELWRHFFDWGAFLNERGHHLVRLRLSNDQLLSIIVVSEYIRVHECLALIAYHVAIDLNIFVLRRHHDLHKLGNLEAERVIK